MKNIKELLKTYENDSDLLYRVENYTHNPDGYICDTISEIADSETSIHYSDLFKWLQEDRDAIDDIEEALREFGTPTSQNDIPDFMKILQQGQYYGNKQKLYENLNTIGKIWLLAYLQDSENITEITEEQAEFIDDLECDNNDKFGEILVKWEEFNTENK